MRRQFTPGQRVTWWSPAGALGMRHDVPARVVKVTGKRVRIKPDYWKETVVRPENLRPISPQEALT